MTAFPTKLCQQPALIRLTQLNSDGQEAFDILEQRGYSVQLGITKADVDQLSMVAKQESIRNYCPKDSTERFRDIDSVTKWLEKGRLVFLLIDNSSAHIAGYGWSGPAKCHFIADAHLTGALRINEDYQGQGLASLLLAIIIDYTQKFCPGEIIWYELWQSNAGAVHVYSKLGFKLVKATQSHRVNSAGLSIDDTRLYMILLSKLS